MKINILCTILLSLFVGSQTLICAQDESNGQRTKWMNEMRDYKCEFLTKEVNLSKEQQTEFLPLYTEMEKEIFKVNKEARDFEQKISNSKVDVSDLEYEKAAESLWEVKQKEAQIENNYYLKFCKILSKKQLFLLKRAETRFSKTMLHHHRATKVKSNT